ncbi:winged helix-turn-helix domain-containing protein [Archaeoglobus sp.]
MEIKFRIWIEKDGEHVIGKGGARILRAIEEEGSISAASKKLGMSYRYVWGYIKRMEKVVGKVVSSSKGGRKGGKSALTERGKEIVEYYEFYESLMEKLVSGDFVRAKVEEGKIIPEKDLDEGEVIILRV